MGKRKVIVVGGGASGLLAAGQAASCGADTLILEKMHRPGRKLAITGKGRCNLTNTAALDEFIAHFGRNGRFLRTAFSQFFSSELVEFFKTLGILTETERGGRIFPVNNDAVKVTAELVQWCKDCGVKIKNKSPVDKLIIENGKVAGVNTLDKIYHADSVIIATGGLSYPATGSSGDGFRLAESAGHTIIPVRPSLTPLETAGNIASRLQGLSLRNINVQVRIDSRKKAEAFGEMLFTHYGLSGPIILTLSRQIVDALMERKKVTVSIDLKPALNEDKLNARLIRDFEAFGKRKFISILKGLLPKKLIPVCIDLTGISAEKKGHQITSAERKQLCNWLKEFRFEVTGYRPFTEAIITAGGISTREIDPRTMQSRLVKGLYFAGEVMDIDGDTGGFNLQAAFSTGWLAGQSSAGS